MNRGISTWLFTKVVMLIFLTMTFAIILSFTSVVQQRAVAEAGEQITINIKDSTLSLLGIKSLRASRHVILPETIPKTSERGEKYTVHLRKSGTQGPNISVAIALGHHDNTGQIDSYLTASSFNIPSSYNVYFLDDSDSVAGNDLVLNSEDYNFVIIESTPGVLNISGCEKDVVGDCQ